MPLSVTSVIVNFQRSCPVLGSSAITLTEGSCQNG
jgi:hypothetical protein